MPAQLDSSASFRHRSAKLVLVALAAVAIITLMAFTARAWWNKPGSAVKQDNVAAQPTPVAIANGYVRRAFLRPQLREALNILGDRVEKPGKERIVFIGTLRWQDNQQAKPLRLILELPGLMRLEEGAGTQLRVIGFDGARAWALDGRLSPDDLAAIETLVFDSSDHFLLSQTRGYATRFLGQRFRLDDVPITKDTVFYDLYQVGDQININAASRSQPKMFYLNSTTQLLERVNYETERNGQPVKVEVLLAGWERSSNQQLPRSITRLENGRETLRIAINAATISQRVNDGIFNVPQGQ